MITTHCLWLSADFTSRHRSSFSIREQSQTIGIPTSPTPKGMVGHGNIPKVGMGINGNIYGTIIAVVARCVLWMPWYVMRSFKEVKELPPQPAMPDV